jgi:glutamine synthetase
LENTEEDAAAGGQCDIRLDLADAFDMCDNQQVFKTPSANIAIAMNELNKFLESPALDAVKAY